MSDLDDAARLQAKLEDAIGHGGTSADPVQVTLTKAELAFLVVCIEEAINGPDDQAAAARGGCELWGRVVDASGSGVCSRAGDVEG